MTFRKRVTYRIVAKGRKYWKGVELPAEKYKNDIVINDVSKDWNIGDVVEFEALITVEQNKYGSTVTVTPVLPEKPKTVADIIAEAGSLSELAKLALSNKYRENFKDVGIVRRCASRCMYDYDRFYVSYEDLLEYMKKSGLENQKVFEEAKARLEEVKAKEEKREKERERKREQEKIERAVSLLEKCQLKDLTMMDNRKGWILHEVNLTKIKPLRYDPDEEDEERFEYIVNFPAVLDFLRKHGINENLQREIEAMMKKEEEAKALREHEQERKKQLREVWERLERYIKDHDVLGKTGIDFPKGEVIESEDNPWDIYGSGERIVVAEDKVFFILNHGADGDDWSWNNVRTGGAGAIGWTAEKNDEVMSLVEKIKELQAKKNKSF